MPSPLLLLLTLLTAQHVFMDSQHYLMVHSLTETQLWAVVGKLLCLPCTLRRVQEGTGFRGGAKSLTFWPEDGANAALVRYSGAAPWSRFDCNGTSRYAVRPLVILLRCLTL